MTSPQASSQDLSGRVALVTGASRGVGKGIALSLGEAGATVYVTGRTLQEGQARLPGTISATAQEVTARGGKGVALRCDHADDEQVQAVAERLRDEAGRLDILVNNVFALPSGRLFNTPFWEQPLSVWDTLHRVGLRSHYVAAAKCVPLMIETGGGLIANVSSFGGASYQINVAYGVGKAAVDRLAKDMAVDLKPYGIASVSLWPGIVRTERIMAMKEADKLPWDMSVSESAELSGRAVRALFADEARMQQSGQVLVVAELAERYGFTDIDGTIPVSLRANSRAKPKVEQGEVESS